MPTRQVEHDVDGVLRDRLDHDRLGEPVGARARGSGRSGQSGRAAGRRGCGRRRRTPGGRHRSWPSATRSRPGPLDGELEGVEEAHVADVPAAHAARPDLPVRGRQQQPRSRARTRPGRAAAAAAGGLSRTDRCWVTSVTVQDFNAKHAVRPQERSGPARARHPRRRRPARRRLGAVGLQRAEQPGPGRPGHPRPDPGRRARARLPPQPVRPRAAQPALAADRGQGGGVPRRPGRAAARPVPARARRVRRRGRLPPDPVPRRRRGRRDRGVPRPARDHRGRRVRARQHPHRRRPGRRAARAGRPVRHVRPLLGRRRRTWPGSTSTAAPASARPPQHVADQGHRRIAHLGWPLDSETGQRPAAGLARGARGPRPRARPARRGARRLRRRPRRRPPAARRAPTRPPRSSARPTPSPSARSAP